MIYTKIPFFNSFFLVFPRIRPTRTWLGPASRACSRRTARPGGGWGTLTSQPQPRSSQSRGSRRARRWIYFLRALPLFVGSDGATEIFFSRFGGRDGIFWAGSFRHFFFFKCPLCEQIFFPRKCANGTLLFFSYIELNETCFLFLLQVCMGLGRWNPRNEVEGDEEMKTVHFNIRKI